MMEFKPLELEDKGIFSQYLKLCPMYLSTYSFPNLFMWRKIDDIQYTIYKDCLIILKKDCNNNYHFLEPVNINDNVFCSIINLLSGYSLKNNFIFPFKNISKSFALKLNAMYYNKITLNEDRESFDYIYSTSDLVNLKGNKFESQRNHYYHFIKNEKFKISEICKENIDECIEWLKVWRPSFENATSETEKSAVMQMLYNYTLLDLKGIAVYVNKKLQGFSIGEKVNNDMVIIHAEKANSKINGLYSYINRTLLQTFFTDTIYVNREEDLGIKGLTKSKLSYFPLWLEPSYSILINI